jgi:3-hydroxyisobutyrate dehydrogenase
VPVVIRGFGQCARVQIGMIGVGRMGLPICANLVRAGYGVTAGDRRAELEGAVVGCGARWQPAAAVVAADADVLITVLPGPAEVYEVMVGRGVLAALPAAAVWIDMTSSSPAAGRALAAAARVRGLDVLEAPMGGGVQAARDGTLQLFVGGDLTLLDRHRRLLEVLARPDRILHVGGQGAGYLTKLLVNLLWFGQAIATAEALLIARSAGLDIDVVRGALTDSAASTAFIRDDLGALLDGDYLTSFGLDRCCEELASVTALAREHHLPAEFAVLVEATYRRALRRFGPIDGELLAAALLEDEAGRLLRHESR